MEFTCTAMRRPGIIADSLASFAENLRGVVLANCSLFVNIDPAPENQDTEATADVFRRYFGTVTVNAPDRPCFPAAVKWCWLQPRGEFFFHLEDDWLLTKPVDFEDMLGAIRRDPLLSLVNLRAYRHNDDRLCLAPGLWRSEHARVIAGRMVDSANPEMQLRPRSASNPDGGAHLGFRGLQHPADVVLKDMGRSWMAVNGLRRAGGRQFTTWR